MEPSTALPGVAAPSGALRIRGRRFGREIFEGYVFLSPALLLLLVFLLIPAIYVFGLSLFKWDLISDPIYIGLANYARLWRDEQWWKAVRQTLYFVVGTVPTSMALALFLAVLLRPKLPGRGLLRATLYSPYITPVVATTILWQWIFNADYGLFNAMLQLFHLPKLGWVRSPDGIMPAIIIYSIWHQTGYSMVIFLAGLANITPDLEEAARVDGANRWQGFWNVTWALLTPTTYFVLFVSMIGSFKVFTQVYVFTSGTGGPDLRAVTVGFYLWEEAFKFFRAGYAGAISVALFVIIVVVTAIQMKLASGRVFYR